MKKALLVISLLIILVSIFCQALLPTPNESGSGNGSQSKSQRLIYQLSDGVVDFMFFTPKMIGKFWGSPAQIHTKKSTQKEQTPYDVGYLLGFLSILSVVTLLTDPAWKKQD